MRLKDKVILVTASTRGIGLAIVKACAAEGAVVLMAARDLEKAKAGEALREILMAIDSVKDDQQKEVLTRRYINGTSYPQIAEEMNYSEPRIYVLHGRALIEVNKWLEKKNGKMPA